MIVFKRGAVQLLAKPRFHCFSSTPTSFSSGSSFSSPSCFFSSFSYRAPGDSTSADPSSESQKPRRVVLVGRPNVGKSSLFNALNVLADLNTKGRGPALDSGCKRAVVSGLPGTTRDYLESRIWWKGSEIELVDTGGLQMDENPDDPSHLSSDMISEIREQCEIAVSSADAIVLVCEAHRQGTHPTDKEILAHLSRSNKSRRNLGPSGRCADMHLVVNKADNEEKVLMAMEFYEFADHGIGDPLPVSASKKFNLEALLDLVSRQADDGSTPTNTQFPSTKAMDSRAGLSQPSSIGVAFVGRPNAGKSTLLNRVLGKQRAIVKDMPGTTRDSVEDVVYYQDLEVVVTDTAGIQRGVRIDQNAENQSRAAAVKALRAEVKSLTRGIPGGPTKADKRRKLSKSDRRAIEVRRHRELARREKEMEEKNLMTKRKSEAREDNLDTFAFIRTKRAIVKAEIVVVVVDALEPFSHRDVHIARMCLRQGRSIVVAVNKLDEANMDIEEYIQWFQQFLPGMSRYCIPIVEMSAKKGWGVKELLQTCTYIHRQRRQTISRQNLKTALQGIISKMEMQSSRNGVSQRGAKVLNVQMRAATSMQAPDISITLAQGSWLTPSRLESIEIQLRRQLKCYGTPIVLNIS